MKTERAVGSGGDEIVLALNSGSSSLKFGLYLVREASVEALLADAMETSTGQLPSFDQIDRRLADAGCPAPTAIGHRIVHGGPDLCSHRLIDAGVETQLAAAVKFAPVHGPASLALIRAARARYPQLPQVACLDTAFHATLPDVARILPLPRDLRAQGLRRYGFHGLSCEAIVQQLGRDLPDRLVIAHLGNGASVTAVKAGRSIDTSMGLTPSGGIVMGSRSGDLDPGVLVYLMREHGLGAEALETLIDHQSGMLGISGLSPDMRRLHVEAASNADAALAIAIFCYSVRKQIAGMIAALEGIDMLVFTGGIGEHDAVVRGAVCDGLRWAGLDIAGTAAGAAEAVSAGPFVRTLPAAEDEQIVRHTFQIVQSDRTGRAQ